MTTKMSTSILALATVFLAVPAYAADPLDRGGLKDGQSYEVAPERVNFSGFYIGGAIGYGNSNHSLTIHDYFKDYCSDDTLQTEFNPFDNSDRSKTLGNRKAVAAGDNTKILNPDYTAANDADSDGQEDGGESGSDYRYTVGEAPTTTWTKCEDVSKSWGENGVHNRGAQVPGSDAYRDGLGGNLLNVPGDSQEVGSLDGVNAHGVVGDVRIGYDQQVGSRFLIGVWGSYGFNAMEAESVNSIAGFLPDAKLEKQDEWAVGARAGLIVAPRTLAYILAGYSQTSYEFSGTETISDAKGKAFSKETDFDGIVVGGGIEFALTPNVFLGAEYQHTFYGEEAIFDTYNAKTNIGGRINDDLDEDKIMATLKIKLNGSGFGGLGY